MNPELEKLEGTWNFVTLEVEGAAMSPAGFQGSQIVVRGDTFTTISMGETYNGSIEIDAGRTPKTINMKFTEGPHAGMESLGIYEINGDDWKICLCFAGGVRPTEFATAVGSGHALETLRRQIGEPVAPAKTGAETPVVTSTGSYPELAQFQGEWIMVSGGQNGTLFPPGAAKIGKRVVEGNLTTVTFGPQTVLQATITIDSSTNPKSIDYVLQTGPHKGSLVYGIFEFAGDTNRLCFAPPGGERPDEFESKPGDGRTLSVWKKA
jgi:uncharacterized protein (TIGR03067 family)